VESHYFFTDRKKTGKLLRTLLSGFISAFVKVFVPLASTAKPELLSSLPPKAALLPALPERQPGTYLPLGSEGAKRRESKMGAASGFPVAEAGNKFEDLSGVEIKPGDNPYDALINACQGSAVGWTPFSPRIMRGRRELTVRTGRPRSKPSTPRIAPQGMRSSGRSS
jgi:hypothetical protein